MGFCYRTLLQSEGCVGMGSVPNAVRRGGIFHFRRAIPVDLQPLFNRAELTCSLRTADVGHARVTHLVLTEEGYRRMLSCLRERSQSPRT